MYDTGVQVCVHPFVRLVGCPSLNIYHWYLMNATPLAAYINFLETMQMFSVWSENVYVISFITLSQYFGGSDTMRSFSERNYYRFITIFFDVVYKFCHFSAF